MDTVLSDNELYDLCKEYGKNAKTWMRKFAVLLPEVFKRNLYRKKHFSTIHEFAAMLAGMSYSTTDQILSLDRALEGKPELKGLIERFGWSKIRVVASIATRETDKFWAEKVKELSKGALETYIRGLKIQERREVMNKLIPEESRLQTNNIQFDSRNQNNQYQTLNINNAYKREKTEPGNETELSQIFPWEKLQSENTPNYLRINLDQETELRLRLIRQQLEKEKKEPVTFAEAIKFLLDEIENLSENKEVKQTTKHKLEQGRQQLKKEQNSQQVTNQNTGQNQTDTATQRSYSLSIQPTNSRYIPAHIRREIQNEYHGKCAFPDCNKPAEILHHTERFALKKQHHPTTIKPLCRAHHEIAHATLIKNEQEFSIKNWELEKHVEKASAFYSRKRIIDEKTRSYKSG